METQFSRTEKLLGKENIAKLAKARVCIFGVGGVGGYAAEALARCGVGHLELVDHDVVALSNLNRQIIATHETIGQYKVDVMKRRILSVNPAADVVTHACFYLPETKEQFDFSKYDYVVDAIDTVAGKIALAMQAEASGTPIICSMGAGNKLDPTAFRVADIYETSVCPLAKVMRKELKKRGIRKLKVVYSREIPLEPKYDEADTAVWEAQADSVGDPAEKKRNETGIGPASRRRSTPGSVSFVPSVVGLIIAGEVVKDLTGLSSHYA